MLQYKKILNSDLVEEMKCDLVQTNQKASTPEEVKKIIDKINKPREYKKTGRIFKKWNGPSAEIYYDLECYSDGKLLKEEIESGNLPEPPSKEKRTIIIEEDTKPYWYVLVEE